jgi:hypothetical protein
MSEHNLSLVPAKYRAVVAVLLEREDSLSDGYDFYCEFASSEETKAKCEGDFVLAALIELAQELEEALR